MPAARSVRQGLLLLAICCSCSVVGEEGGVNETGDSDSSIEVKFAAEGDAEVDIEVHVRTHHSAHNASAFVEPIVDALHVVLDQSSGGPPPPPSARADAHLLPEVRLAPGMYLGSKTAYSPAQAPQTLEPMPAHCRLVHVGHVGRHGSRHGTRLREPAHVRDALLQAAAGGRRPHDSSPTAGEPPPPSQLTVLGEEALRWVEEHMRKEAPLLGELTRGGVKEHYNIAERFWLRHGAAVEAALLESPPRPLVFESTDKKRAIDSRDAFIQGLVHSARPLLADSPPLAGAAPGQKKRKGSKGGGDRKKGEKGSTVKNPRQPELPAGLRIPAGVDPSRVTPRVLSQNGSAVAGIVITPPVCVADIEQNYEFTKLRFFDTCAAFSMFKKSKLWQSVTAPYTANASKAASHERTFLQQLFTPAFTDTIARAGVWSTTGPPSVDSPSPEKAERVPIADLVADMHSICGIQIAAQDNPFQFCSLFERANHMELMRKMELLQDLGDYYKKGTGDPNAYTMSCTLLEDFIATADIGAGIAPRLEDEAKGASAAHKAGKGKRAQRKKAVHVTREGSAAFSSDADWEALHDPLAEPALDPAQTELGTPATGDYAEPMTDTAELTADVRAARRKGAPFANFRFAHAETVMPFISLLGIFEDAGAGQGLEEQHLAQLAAGTSSLLDSMRATLANLTGVWSRPTCSGPAGAGGGRPPLAPHHSAAVAGGGGGAPQPGFFCEDPEAAWKRVLSTGHVAAELLAAVKHPWSTSRLSPMATNIQLEVYDCGDEIEAAAEEAEAGGASAGAGAAPPRPHGTWARILHNEKEVHFPPCAPPRPGAAAGAEEAELVDADRAMRTEWRWRKGLSAYNSTWAAIRGAFGLEFACPWELTKRWYRDVVYPAHDVTSCDARDWKRVCGGTDACSDNLS